MERDEAIRAIRAGIKARAKDFDLDPGDVSVTGGRGTSWGWIRIGPAPRVFKRAGEALTRVSKVTPDEAGWAAEREVGAKIGKLFGLPYAVGGSGTSVPAASDYRREYVDRAEGRTPSVTGTPYWD